MGRHGRPTRNGIKQPAGIDHKQTALAVMTLQCRLGLLFHGDGHGMRRRIITQPNDFGRMIIAASCHQRLEFGNGVRGRRQHLGTRLFGQDLNVASFFGRKGSTQVDVASGKWQHYLLGVVGAGSMIIGRQRGDAKQGCTILFQHVRLGWERPNEHGGCGRDDLVISLSGTSLDPFGGYNRNPINRSSHGFEGTKARCQVVVVAIGICPHDAKHRLFGAIVTELDFDCQEEEASRMNE